MIVLKYCEYGYSYYLTLKRKSLPLEVTKKIIQGMLDEIEYMHNEGIIHRDMKLENVLIFNKEDLEMKIFDSNDKSIEKIRDT